MAIDFDDKNQTTHNGQQIPINTQEKYDLGMRILQDLYEFYEVPWTAASEENYETRVKNGQTFKEIVYNTYDEYLERTSNTPGTPTAKPKK